MNTVRHCNILIGRISISEKSSYETRVRGLESDMAVGY